MNLRLIKSNLSNGLTVLFQPVPNATSVSIGLWVKIGSRYESDDEKGYTHFLEHMLFKGTEKRSSKKQAEDIERVGGFFNAVTSREYTYYYVTVASPELELGLDILSDMVFSPLLREQDIRNESSVILEELKSYEDSPDDYVYDEYFKNIFNNHPLGRDIIGTRESVAGVTENSIQSYYKKHYVPGRMVLSIAGDFPEDEIKRLTEKYFSIKKESPLVPLENSPVTKSFSIHFIKRKLEQVNFLLGAEGFPRDFTTAVRLGVIANILGGGMASRLFQKIREEKGLCYSISCFPSSYLDTGIMNINCATSKDKFLNAVESILEEIRLLKKDGFSQEELDFAKSNQRGGLAIGYEIPENRMTDIAMQELYFGRFYNYENRLEELASVTLDEINDLVGKVFSVDQMHFTGIGNIPKVDIKKIHTKI
ncbi:MAG TPA: pitrilysin family protein [Leptospiraceae bacterium]|nr:pitrilysin family protein [Leptospiraceae bacterium]HMW05359.1 pitrilysin family protein [Leptospiraceae bacterium]HMX34346.1 pitrilysin family protein [Leptospiraceae bacterium]HMY31554.1 pitrilysin family protein [Leptospiraceae bacterium]HMZ66979.1 pitrilysin family protein [Leptospiraceae bacterium]